jgi:hypothetical protein
VISILKYLQAKSINFKYEHPENEPGTKFNFIKSLFNLGDSIYKDDLLSQEEMKEI